MRIAALLLSMLLAAPAYAWPRHGASTGGGTIAPGLVLGTYGSTTASGWTTIGPSDNTMPSFATCPGGTNIVYISDSLGEDNRDGSTPTFVDDNNTAQFVLSSAIVPVVNDVYTEMSTGFTFTVATTARSSFGTVSNVFLQTKNRTGTPPTTGTLNRTSGTGPAGPLTYTARTLGIHGPIKTIIKAISSGIGSPNTTTGPGPYDPDNTGGPFVPNGDGTGLGTIGNWRTAGSVGASFGLRDHCPDWALLRMGDTFVGQAFETNWNVAASDNFQWNGFSEQEPMVISAYDEAVLVTTPDLGSGLRARPIVQVPSSNPAYAGGRPAGTQHAFYARPGMNLTAGKGNYVAVMGIDFYSAQRNPSDGAYVGAGNISNDNNIGIDHRGQQTGSLIEDTHARWFTNGFTYDNASGSSITRNNFDITIRRSQVDHCYDSAGNKHSGIVVDSVGAIGGAMSPGFSFEENVMDLCGWDNVGFTSGSQYSRDAYLQWDAVFGNRRGNTATRSASEGIQFRSGGVIDNNFFYNGNYGLDVGHQEGDPTITSSTTVTNNVVMSPVITHGVAVLGFNFYNANNITATGNIVANVDSAIGDATANWVATDGNRGAPAYLNLTNAGTGGAPGNYAIGAWNAGAEGCNGSPPNFTGGAVTVMGIYSMLIGAGGTITPDPLTGGLSYMEPSPGGASLPGDVLTPVAGYPSINTAGLSLTAVGSGGTLGDYGTGFGHCPRDPASTTPGDTQYGVALTNFSGSMSGSGAAATFTSNSFSGITRAFNGGTGTYHAVGTTTNTNTIDTTAGVGTNKITVTGVTPSAYNSTWTIVSFNSTAIEWDTGLAADPGPVTVPGKLNAFAIIATGKNYVAGDVLSIASTDIGGQTGVRITVGNVAHLSGWTVSVASTESAGTHGLTWTNNIVYNWSGQNPPLIDDEGGTHDSPGGVLGSGTANTFTGNSVCVGSQFTGVITGPNTLTTSAIVNGPIAIGQNLAGPGVTANTTITGGSGTSWTVSPNQTAPSATMYGYTCTPTKVYAHPERTVQTYAAFLGLTATIDGYLYGNGTTTGAMNNAKWNWNPAYTANNGINPYIRLGFQ